MIFRKGGIVMTQNDIEICQVILDRYDDGELAWSEAQEMLYDMGYYDLDEY